jgi:dTDP-4-dehydrorhamnose reductase
MKKLLILGGSGLVGSRFIELTKDQFEVDSPSHNDLDLLNEVEIASYLSKSDAEVVLNLVAITNVDNCQAEDGNKEGNVYMLNSLVPQTLANECKKTGKHLMHVSTDYVFDGEKTDLPYTEEDVPNPINWYGQTKRWAEEFVLAIDPNFTIVRPEMPYSAVFEKRQDFARFFLDSLKAGKEIKAIEDQHITPVFVDFAVQAFAKLIEEKAGGIWQIASADSITPYDFAKEVALQAGLSSESIIPVKFAEFNAGRKASRPHHSWMSVKKFEQRFGTAILKPNKEGIRDFLNLIRK